MKKIVLLASALAIALAVTACGDAGQEQYKPVAGQPADCAKYTLEVNRVKCVQAEGRH